MYEMVDRSLVIVRYSKGMLNWINQVYPKERNFADKVPSSVYLVKEYDTEAEVTAWLKRNFDEIFVSELFNWVTVEDRWPSKRTFKMFQEFFEFEVFAMVVDLEDDPIRKEDEL